MARNARREETYLREQPIITRIWVSRPKTRWVGIHPRIRKDYSDLYIKALEKRTQSGESYIWMNATLNQESVMVRRNKYKLHDIYILPWKRKNARRVTHSSECIEVS